MHRVSSLELCGGRGRSLGQLRRVCEAAGPSVNHDSVISPTAPQAPPTSRIFLAKPAAPLLPSGRRCPEGADEGAFSVRKVAPHQLGRMTYSRAIDLLASGSRTVRGRKSWPRVLSPEPQGEGFTRVTRRSARWRCRGSPSRSRGLARGGGRSAR
jgi:hypothetical protein